ncbi:hypothetical protein HC251_20545 [Iamia sp. SCSIO 61187]|uniref:hypothetical protein n=1 Tax=Iamia sp. SCSIO 61187 TaxID=2722752 RepID=UPI001C638CD5|nr:hypothetical protein [Iamia sp. SCSIO 61187]QYG94587.1 hypothetical protein HC251_20545 [Iamia sp. SCSIO 61187]
MRTSPLGMRRVLRRAPSALLLSLVLVAVTAAACSDDGGDDTSPTTTSPTTEASAAGGEGGEETTTTEDTDETTTTTEGTGTSEAGSEDAGTPLTDAEVAGELERLYEAYVASFVAARERGGLDEQFRGDLARIFFPDLLENEISGIESVGGLAAVVPEPGPIPITDVTVEISQPGCASGSAVFDLRPLVGAAVPGPIKRFFKIEPSEAQTGWRFSALGSTEDGGSFAGASCEG